MVSGQCPVASGLCPVPSGQCPVASAQVCYKLFVSILNKQRSNKCNGCNGCAMRVHLHQCSCAQACLPLKSCLSRATCCAACALAVARLATARSSVGIWPPPLPPPSPLPPSLVPLSRPHPMACASAMAASGTAPSSSRGGGIGWWWRCWSRRQLGCVGEREVPRGPLSKR